MAGADDPARGRSLAVTGRRTLLSSRTMDLRLFPLQTVLFPGMRMPLHIFEERYRIMIRECIEEDAPFGVLLIKSGAEVGGDGGAARRRHDGAHLAGASTWRTGG